MKAATLINRGPFELDELARMWPTMGRELARKACAGLMVDSFTQFEVCLAPFCRCMVGLANRLGDVQYETSVNGVVTDLMEQLMSKLEQKYEPTPATVQYKVKTGTPPARAIKPGKPGTKIAKIILSLNRGEYFVVKRSECSGKRPGVTMAGAMRIAKNAGCDPAIEKYENIDGDFVFHFPPLQVKP